MNVRAEAWNGTASAASFIVALVAGATIAAVADVPPILPALGASLVLAVCEWGFRLPSPHGLSRFSVATGVAWAVSFAIAAGALIALGWSAGASISWVCGPLVPWRISIVIFGAFFSAWIVAGMSAATADHRAEPLVRLMLLWIAPFYGFFHAPWFLAQSLAMPCEGRPIGQSVIATAAMVLAGLAGHQLGMWMFSRRR